MKNINIFCISIILFFHSLNCCGQVNYRFLIDTLIDNKNYTAALHLSERLLCFAPDSTRNDLLITKSKLLILADKPYESYQTISEIITNQSSKESDKSEALIYCAIAFIQMQEYNTALFFIESRPFEESWKNTRNMIGAYCYYMLGDIKTSKEQLSYVGISDDSTALYGNKEIKKALFKKNLNTVLSFLLPGYAYFINQKFGYGFTAMGLNGALLYWTISTATISPLDALFFVLPINMRYYFGTQARASEIYDTKIKQLKNKKFAAFCQKYASYLK